MLLHSKLKGRNQFREKGKLQPITHTCIHIIRTHTLHTHTYIHKLYIHIESIQNEYVSMRIQLFWITKARSDLIEWRARETCERVRLLA